MHRRETEVTDRQDDVISGQRLDMLTLVQTIAGLDARIESRISSRSPCTNTMKFTERSSGKF